MRSGAAGAGDRALAAFPNVDFEGFEVSEAAGHERVL
jgi:hypothetical protein